MVVLFILLHKYAFKLLLAVYVCVRFFFNAELFKYQIKSGVKFVLMRLLTLRNEKEHPLEGACKQVEYI